MADNPMLKAAELLKQLRDQKDDLEERLKNVNAKIEEADMALSDMMAESETQNFTHCGTMFCLTTKVRANAKAGLRNELFAALRANGAGDMVVETVNANTLSSFVKEQMAENNDQLPAWLEPVVTVFEKTTVGVRKASRK